MPITSPLKILAVLTITLCTASCGMFSKDRPLIAENKAIATSARHQQVMAMGSWQVNGSLSISAQGKTNSGTFTWTQNDSVYDFQTFGPLNMAGIRINGRPGQVTLWKSANNRVFAHTPEQLMARELGWYLPLSNLHYWARGVAAPGQVAKAQYDQFGHLVRLQQQGWTIDYLRFQGVNGMDLPQLVVVQQQNLRAKIAFQRWRIKSA